MSVILIDMAIEAFARRNPPEMFLGKGVLKIYNKFIPMLKYDFNKVAKQIY